MLLVEDDELIGTLVEMNLAHEGWSVTWERSGEAALEQLTRESFDLVLLDYMLPGIDGIALAKELRRRGLAMPILMLTVRSATTDKVAALDAGIDDHLSKPFDVAELVARVRALARRPRRGATD